jgi:hypothetical protein
MNRTRLFGIAVISTLLTIGAAAPAAAFYQGKVPRPETPAQATSVAADPDGTGYWTMVDAQGISAHDGATFHGTLSNPRGTSFGTIVATPDGNGYWAVNYLTGTVDSFGSAPQLPSFQTTGYKKYSGVYLTDVASTPSGRGLVALDWSGHVWTLGDGVSYGDVAKFSWNTGSPGATAIRLTPSGRGYLIAGAGGNVWGLGDAVARGGLPPNQYKPITSMAPTGTGNGYWLVDSYGTVTAFGDATAQPGTLTNPTSPVTYIVTRPNGAGYYLAHENGAVDAFGADVTVVPPGHCHRPRPRLHGDRSQPC